MAFWLAEFPESDESWVVSDAVREALEAGRLGDQWSFTEVEEVS